MKLTNLKEAINIFRKHLGYSCEWNCIDLSYKGTIFIFHTIDTDGAYYLFYRESHRIEKVWPDTWRTGRREVIWEGDF